MNTKTDTVDALVTGGRGFAGSFLLDELRSSGAPVYSCVRNSQPRDTADATDATDTADAADAAEIVCDLNDIKQVNAVFGQRAFSSIYHLAATSSVVDAEQSLEATLANNVVAPHNLLAAALSVNPELRFLYVSSSDVYGTPQHDVSNRISELTPAATTSFYGISKLAAERVVLNLCARQKGSGIIVRPFPHIGPGQRPTFAVASFAKQLASIKLGRAEPVLKTGNLNVIRDYSDVRDIVRGYKLAMQHGNHGEIYNLCSGKPQLLSEIVEMLIDISAQDITLQTESSRLRKNDLAYSVGYYNKARDELGWMPEYTLRETLSDLYDYWVAELSAEAS